MSTKYWLWGLFFSVFIIDQVPAQPTLDTTFLQPFSRAIYRSRLLPHPQRDAGLVLTGFGGRSFDEPTGLQYFDSTGTCYPYQPLAKTEKLFGWGSPVAYQVDAQNTYHLYFYDWWEKTLHLIKYDPQRNETDIQRTLFQLSDNELPLGIVGPTPKGLMLATVHERSSLVSLYQLYPDQSEMRLLRRYELKEEYSQKRPSQTFSSTVASLTPFVHRKKLKALGISPWRKAHLEPGLMASSFKFTANEKRAVWTTESRHGTTYALTLPFDPTEEARLHQLDSDCKACQPLIEPIPSSTVIADHLFQVHSSRRAVNLRIYSLADGSLVHDQIFFKNPQSKKNQSGSPLSLSGGLKLAPSSSQDSSLTKALEREFFRCNNLPLRVSAFALDGTRVSLRFGPFLPADRTIGMLSERFHAGAGHIWDATFKFPIAMLETTFDLTTLSHTSTQAPSIQPMDVLLQCIHPRILESVVSYYASGPYLWVIMSPGYETNESWFWPTFKVEKYETFELRRYRLPD